ncbi:MAG: GNAT family N-acetyltransferase [Syntrophobacteraceae bacterium]|jgi:GNAT superfamily N-acetyltransferase
MRYFEMIVKRASFEDAKEILGLQKLAYASEAEIYNDYSISPLTQTLDQIQADFESRLFLKASVDGSIVGSVRGSMDQGTCHIGRLMVHPDFQNRGIGARLMKEIERCFHEAERYELFTGHLSERNLRLYHKLGYIPFAFEAATASLTFVFMEKHPCISMRRTSHPLFSDGH